MARIGRRRLPAEPVAARVPVAIFTGGKAGAMTRAKDELGFEVYLWALKAGGGKGPFDFAYAPLAEALGMAGRPPEEYRKLIRRALERLQDKYGLLRVAPRDGEDARVEVVESSGETVGVRPEYWSWGWCRRLTFPGEVMFLLNRRYSALSADRPRWSFSVATIARENGLSADFVTLGTVDLRRADLVEVDYDALDKDAERPRRPSVYTPRPLYDPATLDRAWEDLTGRYGAEKVARARKCAVLVYEDSDADAVERFIHLEDEFGRERVERAYGVIALKSPDNPRRSAGYFFELIRRGTDAEPRVHAVGRRSSRLQ
jgi:hypothetical protein